MRRLVDFGINESSTMDRLDSGHSKLDLVNGTGEYLGIIQIDGRKVMITRTISSGANLYNGQLMANEVEYDIYSDGSIAVYYSSEKTEDLLRLQEMLNNPVVAREMASGKSLYEVMILFGIAMDRSYGTERIEKEFHPSKEYIYPDDYDFEEALKLGPNYPKDKDVKKMPVEKMIVTGIPNDLFENLKQARKYTHMSTYQVAALLRKLEEEKSMDGRSY